MENRFKEARTKYNQHGSQTTREVADAAGITKSLIEDIESTVGTPRNVGYLTVKKLAQYYGVSSDFLLGLSGTPSVDEDTKVVFKVTGLSEKAISTLNKADNDERDFVSYLIENRVSRDISQKAYLCANDKRMIKALDEECSTVGLDQNAVKKMIRESDDVRRAFNEVVRLRDRVDTSLWRCHKILESAVESFIDYVIEREVKSNGKRKQG